MHYKVTLTRLLACGDTIGVRHLDFCDRELAGEVARAFADGVEVGHTISIASVEIVTGENADGNPVKSSIVTEVARATLEADGERKVWRRKGEGLRHIAGVTCPMPEPARLDASRDAQPLTRLVASGVPNDGQRVIVAANAIQDTRTGEKTRLDALAPTFASLLA